MEMWEVSRTRKGAGDVWGRVLRMKLRSRVLACVWNQISLVLFYY